MQWLSQNNTWELNGHGQNINDIIYLYFEKLDLANLTSQKFKNRDSQWKHVFWLGIVDGWICPSEQTLANRGKPVKILLAERWCNMRCKTHLVIWCQITPSIRMNRKHQKTSELRAKLLNWDSYSRSCHAESLPSETLRKQQARRQYGKPTKTWQIVANRGKSHVTVVEIHGDNPVPMNRNCFTIDQLPVWTWQVSLDIRIHPDSRRVECQHRPFSWLTVKIVSASKLRPSAGRKIWSKIHKSTNPRSRNHNQPTPPKPTFQIPPIYLNMWVIYEDFVRSSYQYIISEGSLELFRPLFLGGYVWAGVFHSAWT